MGRVVLEGGEGTAPWLFPATDEEARVKFRRYWRLFGVGIVMIRLLLLPAVRRQAERRWRASGSAGR